MRERLSCLERCPQFRVSCSHTHAIPAINWLFRGGIYIALPFTVKTLLIKNGVVF